MYKKLLYRLPDNYNKNDNSNIGKLYQVLSKELEILEKVFEDIEESKDIDKATNKSLELIGKNVLEYRNHDDEWYRKFIKIKILANRSVGDFRTINTVADFLIGDSFLGVEETWKYPYFEDIAGLAGTIKSGFGDMFKTPIVTNALDRTRAGGVKWHWLVKAEEEHRLNIAITNRSLRANKYGIKTIEDFNMGNLLNIGISSRQAKFENFSIKTIEDMEIEHKLNIGIATRKLKNLEIDSYRWKLDSIRTGFNLGDISIAPRRFKPYGAPDRLYSIYVEDNTVKTSICQYPDFLAQGFVNDFELGKGSAVEIGRASCRERV